MKVAVIMGSTSDYDVMKGACETLETFGVPYEKKVVSAHRTPEYMFEFAKAAKKNGFDVIIAGAGGAAHLPGMVAAMTVLPVVGVPVKSRALSGMDSLLSIVQMPKGVPVATVGINQSENAALIACKVLAISNAELSEKLEDFTNKQRETVLACEI